MSVRLVQFAVATKHFMMLYCYSNSDVSCLLWNLKLFKINNYNIQRFVRCVFSSPLWRSNYFRYSNCCRAPGQPSKWEKRESVRLITPSLPPVLTHVAAIKSSTKALTGQSTPFLANIVEAWTFPVCDLDRATTITGPPQPWPGLNNSRRPDNRVTVEVQTIKPGLWPSFPNFNSHRNVSWEGQTEFRLYLGT